MSFTTAKTTVEGHTCWRVSGPLGTVDYMLVGNHLRVASPGGEPDSMLSRHANEARSAAYEGDDAIFPLLVGWYERLPELFPDAGLDIRPGDWIEVDGHSLVVSSTAPHDGGVAVAGRMVQANGYPGEVATVTITGRDGFRRLGRYPHLAPDAGTS
jgi:hypothetical protein